MQSGGLYARHAEINGFPAQVQTVLGHASRSGPEKFVAPEGPVPTDNIDFSARMSRGIGQFLKDVVDAGIEVPHLSGAVIAQEVVEFRDRLGNILVSSAEHNVEPLAGMCVKQ